VHVRDATTADLELVAELRLQFLAEHRGIDRGDLSEGFRATTVDFLRRHDEAGTGRSWLAVHGDVPIGVVTMLLLDLAPRPEDASGHEGYLINMYVDPAHRRGGVGRELLTAVRRCAEELGLRRLVLYATDEGRPLYERAGFGPNEQWMELRL